MQKIYNEDYFESYYIKTLTNGLTVILFEKPKFHNNFFTLITPYGGGDYQQIDNQGNKYYLPPGVAHFLEHRMFDYQGFDVLEKFSEYGSNVNASTGYDQTQYYFSTTNNDFTNSLNLLLDFVFDLKIPAESVEKEKGIIIEELKMYDNMVDFKLYFNIIKNLYHNLPYIEDIGGSIESVSATTLADLELAYKLNYHPSQMFLVGSTNNNIADVISLIEENMSKKNFNEARSLKRDYLAEELSVSKAYQKDYMDINKSKLAVGYKFKHGESNPLEMKKIENLLTIFFELLFTSINEQYQIWVDEKLVNDYFDVDVSVDEDFGHIIFSVESEDENRIVEFIESVLADYDKYLSVDKFNQVLKRTIGKMILALEQPSSIALIYGRNIANGVDIFESLAALKAFKFEDLLKLLERFDLFSHKAVYIINKK